MKIKHVWKSGLFLSCGLAIAFASVDARAQALSLWAGTSTSIDSSQAVCGNNLTNVPDEGIGDLGTAEAGCSGGRIFMTLTSGTTALPHRLDVTGIAQLTVPFRVDRRRNRYEERDEFEGPGDSDGSRAFTPDSLPVTIAIPVRWKGSLWNDSVIPQATILSSVDATSEVNGKVFLAESQGGAVIVSNHFMGAYHAGIAGCLTIPETDVQAALMAGSCVVAVHKKEEGEGTIYLSGIIETNKTYDLVLELDGHIASPDIRPVGPSLGPILAHPILLFHISALAADVNGLFWTAPATIRIGTDFRARMQDLGDEIAQLKAKLNEMQSEGKPKR